MRFPPSRACTLVSARPVGRSPDRPHRPQLSCRESTSDPAGPATHAGDPVPSHLPPSSGSGCIFGSLHTRSPRPPDFFVSLQTMNLEKLRFLL